jgi:hypothetical protein
MTKLTLIRLKFWTSAKRDLIEPSENLFDSHIFSHLLCDSPLRSPANEVLSAPPRLSMAPGQGLVPSAGKRHPYLEFSVVISPKEFIYEAAFPLCLIVLSAGKPLAIIFPFSKELSLAHQNIARSRDPSRHLLRRKCSTQTTKQKP